jgi:hypothetical protein
VRRDTLTHKESHRLFWIVKGHLGNEQTVIDSANSYFNRLWTTYQGEDTSYIEEGFEKAYYEKYPERKCHTQN